MKPEAWFVLLTLGSAHREGALAALRHLAARLLPRARLAGVVVDNALDGNVEIELDADTTCISGDNRWREFSGWDRGLAWLESAHGVERDAVLLLANDTLHRSYGSDYLEGFTTARLRAALDRQGLLGWTDAYPREVVLFGLPVQRWVRTSLIVAARATVDRLRPFALPCGETELFGCDGGELFATPSPLSERYRAYLRTWLLGEPGDNEFAERWHSAAPLSPANADQMRGKIRSILCEHSLSARARALGVPLVDVR